MFSISASCLSRLGTLSNDLHDEDNNSVKEQLFLLFLVHFFDVHCTTTTWSLPMRRFMEDVEIWFSFLYLNMDKALKNSTPGKVAYIGRIERFQIHAIKIERTQIHFSVMFSLPSSSSMPKVPITTRTIASRKKTESGFTWPNKMSGDSECRQKTYEVIKDVNSKIVMPKAILF